MATDMTSIHSSTVVIGINHAAEFADLTYLVIADTGLYETLHDTSKWDSIGLFLNKPDGDLRGAGERPPTVRWRTKSCNLRRGDRPWLPNLFTDPFPINGNGAFYALCIARLLGCDPITFIGVDLNLDPNVQRSHKRKTHTHAWGWGASRGSTSAVHGFNLEEIDPYFSEARLVMHTTKVFNSSVADVSNLPYPRKTLAEVLRGQR